MPDISVRIHYETKSGRAVTKDTLMSHIHSALYGRMGDWEWTSVTVKHDLEDQALVDENNSLREENKLHADWLVEVSELLPPSYDADEAVEAIIITFVKDMTELGRITAKLGADYR